MMILKGEPAIHILTALGVVLGSVLWLPVYASHFGSIEFDGPAGLGLMLALVIGGVVGGITGVIYDTRHQQRLAKTLFAFVAALIISCALTGAILGDYAMRKWDYAAAHHAECQAPENTRPLACQ
jgi:hypothetical protein